MQKTTVVRTAIAAGVAGLGLSMGGVALAAADDASTVRSGDERPGPGGRGGHLAAALAEELRLDEDDVAAALEEVHDELRPDSGSHADGERPDPPTEEERAARQKAFADALAEELDVSSAKVSAALETLRDAAEAEGRELLGERLDQAVADGELTAADKASVLKAYDAGVLGGGHGGPGGRGHGPR
jgi:hypothetical protein